MDWILLIVGACFALLGLNVHRPPRRPAFLAVSAFFCGWVAGELPLHFLVVDAAAVALLVAGGGLDAWPGWLGLALGIVGAAAFLLALRAHDASRDAVEAMLGEPLAPTITLRQRIYPFWMRHPGTRRLRNLPIARDISRRLIADITAPRAPTERAPVLVFVHGGAWIFGFRRFQALPLMRRLASRGWVCVSVGYRLSPRATFPDHIVDVKRALGWTRDNIAGYGGDPARIYLHGNSAGGHLAALAALTAEHTEWNAAAGITEPVRVAGCVPCYGIYDLLHRAGPWPHARLTLAWELLIIKARISAARDRFADASPWEHVTPDAPPFLVVQGTHDSLVPVTEARNFVAHFEAIAPGRCTYLEVPGAQHAFDVFDSPRSLAVVEGIARWLEGEAESQRGPEGAPGGKGCSGTGAAADAS